MAISFALQVLSTQHALIQTNAIPTCAWLIAYLATLNDPSQRQEVMTHISQYFISQESTKTSTVFNFSGLSQDSLLNSAVSETLRLQMNGLSPRTIENDTQLTVSGQSYSLRKGEVIFITMSGVHKNDEMYSNPSEFQLKRFLDMHDKSGDYKATRTYMKNGTQVRNPFIWWGGGIHIVSSQ